MLAYEHTIVRPGDLRRLDAAFFTVNGVISLVFFAVAEMGPLYLVAAVVLGAIFLWRAFTLWRQAASPEGSLAQAIRLYKFSISYLTLLFAAVAVDALVIGTAG